MALNDITGAIIASAIRIHRELGPGLLESAYEACMVYDLRKNGFKVEHQVELPIVFDGVQINAGYRIDLIVNDTVIVEHKAVEELHPIFDAQIISYLKLSGKPVGLIINFHVVRLVDGVRRFKNG